MEDRHPFPIDSKLVDETFKEIVRCIRSVYKGKPIDYQGIDCGEPIDHIYSAYLENDSSESDHDQHPLYRIARIAFSLGICQGYSICLNESRMSLGMISGMAKSISGMLPQDSDLAELANEIVRYAESAAN